MVYQSRLLTAMRMILSCISFSSVLELGDQAAAGNLCRLNTWVDKQINNNNILYPLLVICHYRVTCNRKIRWASWELKINPGYTFSSETARTAYIKVYYRKDGASVTAMSENHRCDIAVDCNVMTSIESHGIATSDVRTILHTADEPLAPTIIRTTPEWKYLKDGLKLGSLVILTCRAHLHGEHQKLHWMTFPDRGDPKALFSAKIIEHTVHSDEESCHSTVDSTLYVRLEVDNINTSFACYVTYGTAIPVNNSQVSCWDPQPRWCHVSHPIYVLTCIRDKHVTLTSDTARPRVGDTVTLTCIANIHPTAEIYWSSGSRQLRPLTEGSISFLKLDNVSESDAGVYQCIAWNVVYGDLCTASASLLLTVRGKLSIVIGHNHNTSTTELSPTDHKGKTGPYEHETWALHLTSVLILIVVMALVLLVCCRKRIDDEESSKSNSTLHDPVIDQRPEVIESEDAGTFIF